MIGGNVKQWAKDALVDTIGFFLIVLGFVLIVGFVLGWLIS